ncbi:hypothetical protein EWM64_g10659 [Hericium alpestre]|uniref:Uncharacterized protein n=1 Tax=Hericium alpestre TaxID=135208 RepID=A0A4Y9ZHQ4_9AGAM|nr:hypothetical protein EWM64_g10659 [Hericium alpestre]
MIPSLPFEMVMKIMELSYYAHADSMSVDVETLGACAAVCKEWSTFARKLLFFEVVLKLDLKTKGAILLLNAGRLGACIRSLTVDAIWKPDVGDPNFIDVLSYCPALYQLDLYLHSRILELTTLEVSRLIALPVAISALRFRSYNEQESHVLYQLMAIWPTIQFLALDVNKYALAPPPAERPPFSLYELRINQILPAESVMRWLLPPIPTGQSGSLRILSTTLLEDLAFTEYAPYVRALAVSCRFSRNAVLLAPFNALEELFLDDIDFAASKFDTREDP